MVRIHRTLQAVAMGIAIISSRGMAQSGSTMSLVHTVSVTVPSRVKVQVATAPMSVSLANRAAVSSATQGLAINIAATRAWVLSSGGVTVASGGLSSAQRASEVIIRKPARSGSAVDSTETPVVLTISAP
jgi:hypothetical protein